MRVLLVLAALLVTIGFVRPSSVSADLLTSKARVVASALWDALEDMHTEYLQAESEKSQLVKKLMTTIGDAVEVGNAHACRALEPFPLYAGAPSAGDFIAYCLARVQKDLRRCDQIAPLTAPELRALCMKEFSAR